jgi:hypothetical protein
MEKFIYTYLSENYYIQTSEVGNHGIYQKYDDRRIPVPFNGDRLVKDVVTVFGVTKDEAHRYIYEWSRLVEPDVDLTFYWKMAEEFGSLVFPVIQSVAARTISQDLVSVQPMSAPTGDLLYLDYVYSKESMFEKVIKFFQNIYKRIFGIFKN